MIPAREFQASSGLQKLMSSRSGSNTRQRCSATPNLTMQILCPCIQQHRHREVGSKPCEIQTSHMAQFPYIHLSPGLGRLWTSGGWKQSWRPFCMDCGSLRSMFNLAAMWIPAQETQSCAGACLERGVTKVLFEEVLTILNVIKGGGPSHVGLEGSVAT